jgi:hypothetical protein
MTFEEAKKDAQIRADLNNINWYVVKFDYGYDTVSQYWKGNKKIFFTAIPKIYKMTKKDKEIIDKILNTIPWYHNNA